MLRPWRPAFTYWSWSSWFRWRGAPDSADSIAQDVMLRVMHGLTKLDDTTRFNAWLRQITINTSRTHLARERAEMKKRAAYADTVEASNAREAPDDEIDAASYADLIASLDPDERTVVTLKVLEDLEFQEIADILNIALSAAKMRYYRALKRLKIRLSDNA